MSLPTERSNSFQDYLATHYKLTVSHQLITDAEAFETAVKNQSKLNGPAISSISQVLEYYHQHSIYLKLVSAIFYEIFIFSPNDSPSKTIVFYFIEKALFVLEILKFL